MRIHVITFLSCFNAVLNFPYPGFRSVYEGGKLPVKKKPTSVPPAKKRAKRKKEAPSPPSPNVSKLHPPAKRARSRDAKAGAAAAASSGYAASVAASRAATSASHAATFCGRGVVRGAQQTIEAQAVVRTGNHQRGNLRDLQDKDP